MKDTDYYAVRWTTNAAITQTKLPQVISLIPVLGYAVLYGDQFQNFVMQFTALGPDVLFTPSQRICLLYVGGISVLVGLIIFYVFCPAIIRLHKTRDGYIRHVMETSDYQEVERMYEAMRELMHQQHKEGGEFYFDEFPVDAVRNAMKLSGGFLPIFEVFRGTKPRGVVYPGLAAYFEATNRTRWLPSLLCTALMLIGAFLFLLPSLEVFLMVLDRVISAALS